MKRKHSATFALALTVCLFGAINSPATVRYVNVNGTNPTPPYTNWVTAATNIQDAVSVASAGDTIVVTNGVYPGGFSVTQPVALRSVNGPRFTIIDGGGTNRCASLMTNGASLTGLTLTNGYVYRDDGGGVWCASTNAFLTNCIIVGNHPSGEWVIIRWGLPHFSGGIGGGVFGGTLYNCLLTGNSGYAGGGAANCILYNCTLAGNGCQDSSLYAGGMWWHYYGSGGGAAGSVLYNCIAHFNNATRGENYDTSVLNYCCTTPMPTNGVGNITNAPLFVDYANGDLHLQTNSPGINAGNNDFVATATDLDGNPRIAGGTVDMGAYEFQPCISGGQLCSAACSPLTGFSFTFSDATVGQPYRIQTSPSLAAGSWSDLTNFTYTGPIVIADPLVVAVPKKFYRAVSP